MSYYEMELMLTAIRDFIDRLNETVADSTKEVKKTNEQYREAIKIVGELNGRVQG